MPDTALATAKPVRTIYRMLRPEFWTNPRASQPTEPFAWLCSGSKLA
jgi:hypothetical protein